MSRIVFEDATGGEVNDDKATVTAHVSKGESTSHVSTDGLYLVSLTPVHVGASGDTGSVEHVCWFHLGYVGFQ